VITWRARTWRAFRLGVSQFVHNRLAVVGVVIILLYGLAGFVYPFLLGTVWPTGVYHPVTGFDPNVVSNPAPPGNGHVFGTDALGRDVLSQLLAATRPTWIMAMVAAFTTAIVATFAGGMSALFRGWTDAVLSRLSDAFLLLPAPIFMLVIGSSERSQDIGPIDFGFIYGVITGIGAGAIVIRAQALKIIAAPFIDAARVAGAGRWRILGLHVLPHLYPLAAVYMMLAVVGAVVADGFAAWLGQTGTRVNWGTLVYNGVTFMNPITGTPAWNAIIPPSIALSVFAAAFYLVSVGLREVADPRYRAARRRTVDPF
jgi:peptide/nickel transport system permease protein